MIWLILACNQPDDSGGKAGVIDADQDGAPLGEDCDDGDPARFPGQVERCDEVDNNCDGKVDNDAADAIPYYRDADGDGYGVATLTTRDCAQPDGYVSDASDCDDLQASVYPGAPETCDGADEDCDGTPDNHPVDAPTWTLDADGDGFGGTPVEACSRPLQAVDDTSDCNDTDPTIFPGAHTREVPGDGVDPDCDGQDICVDLSCDGWPDIAFASNSSPWLAGPDLSAGGMLGGSPSAAVAIGDVDQDGYLDLVLASYFNGSSYRVDSRLVYGGAGGPGASTLPLSTTGASGVAVSDLDGNGWNDLVFAQERSDSGWDVPSLLWFNQGGSLGSPVSLPTVGARAVVATDLDGDGSQELVFACHNGDGRASSSLVFQGPDYQQSTGLPEASGLCTGDLDGDGAPDLVLLTDADALIYHNRGGTLSLDSVATPARSCLIADLDGLGPALLLLNDTSQSADQRLQFATPGATAGWAQDLDRDGRPELIVASTGKALRIQMGNAPTELTVTGSSGLAGW